MLDPDLREEIEFERTPNTKEEKVPKDIITLGGVAVNKDGKLTRTEFFRFIGHDLDSYSDVQLLPEQAKRIHHHIQKLSTGSAAMVPLFCGGEKCPFKDRCPLFAIKKHPLGRQCLIEVQLMKEWIMRYFDEYDLDPNNFTEVGYVNELAEIEILLMRLNMIISRPENAELVIDQIVGMSNDGETPLVQKQISPFMDQKEKLQNRRSKIIKLMVGDRQEKYKKEAALKMRIEEDPSSKMAAMRAKLEALSRELGGLATPDLKGRVSPEDIINSVDDIPHKG
jgi:hypothetical protein